MRFVYNDFKKFFDYEKEINKVKNNGKKSELLEKIIEYKKGGH